MVARSRQKSSLLPLALRVVLHPPNPSKQGKQQILSASLPTAIERERERAEEKRDLLQKCHLQARSPIGKAHRWRGSVPLTALTHPPLDSSNEQQQQHHHHTLLTTTATTPFALWQPALQAAVPFKWRFSTKLAAGLRSVARNNKATRLLTRPG